MKTLEELYTEAKTPLAAFDAFSETYKLAGKAVPDHIGYKCGSKETFEYLRSLFETNSIYIYQSIISQRRIAIIRLRTPFVTTLGDISYFELSDQKPDGSQKDGFDHLEVVATDGSLPDLVRYIETQGASGVTSVRPHHSTHDFMISEGFKLRVEPCPLIEKIQREEMTPF